LSLDSKLVETHAANKNVLPPECSIHYTIKFPLELAWANDLCCIHTHGSEQCARSGIRTTKIYLSNRWHRAASGATLYMVTNYFHELIERRRERKIAALQAAAEGQCQPYTFTTWLALRGAQSLAPVQPQQVSPLDSRHYSSL
jgi:hypothetical protein